jgi:hypothetical protein
MNCGKYSRDATLSPSRSSASTNAVSSASPPTSRPMTAGRPNPLSADKSHAEHRGPHHGTAHRHQRTADDQQIDVRHQSGQQREESCARLTVVWSGASIRGIATLNAVKSLAITKTPSAIAPKRQPRARAYPLFPRVAGHAMHLPNSARRLTPSRTGQVVPGQPGSPCAPRRGCRSGMGYRHRLASPLAMRFTGDLLPELIESSRFEPVACERVSAEAACEKLHKALSSGPDQAAAFPARQYREESLLLCLITGGGPESGGAAGRACPRRP